MLNDDLQAPDAYAVLAGLMTIHVGAEMAFARTPSLFWGVASLYVFVSALALILAGVTDIEVGEWGRPLAGFAFLALLVGVSMTYLMIRGSPIQTDALAFINEAAARLLQGQSPYTGELTTGETWPTPTVSGGRITTYSYPLGSALAVAPFRAITPDGARVAVIAATVIGGGLLIWHAPHELAPLGLIAYLIGDFITWGVSDLTDPLWVAPLLAAMVVWPWSRVGRDDLRLSAILFGIAMAMKQHPWFCAPFLFLWVARERGWRPAVRYAGVVAAVFWAIMLPALVLSPVATIEGLLTNLFGPGGTLVHLGVGVSALTLSGAYPIAKGAHTLMMGAVGLGLVALYWLQFGRLRWVAWLAWGPLLLFNYRSLANYFVVIAPIAVMILIARHGRDATVVTRDATA